MINVFVKILNVGSGNATAYGMASGNLQWSSTPDSLGQFYQGIIDEATVQGVAAACNISQGGTLGGFSGDVTLGATGVALYNAIVGNAITIMGATVQVYVGTTNIFSAATLRYTGKVGAFACPDEITTEIVCSPTTSFNQAIVPSVTVTQAMALNAPTSPAIGKSVTTTYGQLCDFPLINVSPTEPTFPLSLLPQNFADDGSTLVADFNTPERNVYGSTRLPITSSGIWKGNSLLQIYESYVDATSGNIWIALSFNGTVLFGAGSSGSVSLLQQALIGMHIQVVRGTGALRVYNILDVTYNTFNSLTSIWIEINETVITNIQDVGHNNAAWKKLSVVAGMWEFNTGSGTRGDASYIEFVQSNSLFIVSSSALTSSAVVMAVDSTLGTAQEIVVPTQAITCLYKGPVWAMINVNVAALVQNTASSFSFVNLFPVVTRLANGNVDDSHDYTALNGATYDHAGATDIPNYRVDALDSLAEGQIITQSTLASMTLVLHTGATSGTSSIYNSFYITLEDLFNGVDISNTAGVFLIPALKYEWKYSDLSQTTPLVHTINISIDVVGEGNIVVGQVSYRFSKKLSAAVGASNVYWSFEISSSANAFIYSASIATPTAIQQNDYASFSNMVKALDLSTILKASSSTHIRYFHVSVVAEVNTPAGVGSSDVSWTINKTLNPCVMGVNISASKDKLYLHTQRDNTANGYAVQSPAMLAASIAKENGLSLDIGSFVDVHATMRGLYTGGTLSDPTLYNGQYQPSDNAAVSDALSEICKSAMMTIYPLPSGTLECNWFASKNAGSPVVFTFDGNSVMENSIKISKPSNGYRYTDFVFSITQNMYQAAASLYVNTDGANVSAILPPANQQTPFGYLFNAANGYSIMSSGYSTATYYYAIVQLRGPASLTPLILQFVGGTLFTLVTVSAATVIAALDSVAPDFLSPIGQQGVYLAFRSTSPITGGSYLVSLQQTGAAPDWTAYVSGTLFPTGANYTLAQNIWSAAQKARVALGAEYAMPSGTTTLKNPVWGDDPQALIEWILYTVIFCTRDKTVIKFDAPMTSGTIGRWIMDYVAFNWGAYQGNPVKGWIVDIEDDYANGVFHITLLTSVSDSDALVLDERVAGGAVYTEMTPGGTVYNEGILA